MVFIPFLFTWIKKCSAKLCKADHKDFNYFYSDKIIPFSAEFQLILKYSKQTFQHLHLFFDWPACIKTMLIFPHPQSWIWLWILDWIRIPLATQNQLVGKIEFTNTKPQHQCSDVGSGNQLHLVSTWSKRFNRQETSTENHVVKLKAF